MQKPSAAGKHHEFPKEPTTTLQARRKQDKLALQHFFPLAPNFTIPQATKAEGFQKQHYKIKKLQMNQELARPCSCPACAAVWNEKHHKLSVLQNMVGIIARAGWRCHPW